jgi:DNA-directed RNA polymerase specialized sigma24 family protein
MLFARLASIEAAWLISPIMTLPDLSDHHRSALWSFLHAATEPEAERYLDTLLLTHAAPIIKRILSAEAMLYPLREAQRRQYADDVYADVLVHLVERLRNWRMVPFEGQIPDFGGYVAVTTYNAANQLLRKLYPQRANLKNKLRYLLERHPELALWQGRDGLFLAGLAEWRDQDRALSSGQFRQLVESSDEFERINVAHSARGQSPLAELLRALFVLAGQPLAFSALVAVVAEVCGIGHHPEVSIEGPAAAAREYGSEPGNVPETLEQRELLRRAWEEIRQLPPRQRAAYLLNFKETQGHADITTFLFTRTVGPEDLAAALEMSLTELAELWRDLPLSDAQIAERLGATRQQVISLRKCARERLRRRLGILKLVVGAVTWLYPAAVHMFNR